MAGAEARSRPRGGGTRRRHSTSSERRGPSLTTNLAVARAPWRLSTAPWCRIPLVGFVRPCEPTFVDRPPAGAGWLHEVKHDGFRILVRKLGKRAKVSSRRGADFTDRFLGIVEAVHSLTSPRGSDLVRPLP
jgi:bifunctional non-homologous end joining protein LigD